MPVDFQVEIHAIICQDFDAIRELCRSPNVAIPEDAIIVLRLELQNLNCIMECSSAVAANLILGMRMRR